MTDRFHPQQQLPDILRRYPHVREVFDRYGLRGCGGAHGPAESLEFFARSHGVSLERLTRELEQAVTTPPTPPTPAATPEHTPSFADAVYRPYFIAGIAVFVLVGVVVGTTMLAWMSSDASFFAPGLRRMNAHANAMVYGFAGMFIMGFGYQALPRFRHTQLWRPDLALAGLGLLITGVTLRFVGEFFGQQTIFEPALLPGAYEAGVAGTALQLAAFAIFAIVMWKTLRTDGRLRTYERYVFAGVAWFMISLVVSLAIYIRLNRAEHFGDMVAAVAIYQESLRIIQMFGAIGLVVVGVMLRFLPTVFGFRDPGEKLFNRMLWVLNGGILLSAVMFPLSMMASRGLIDGAWLSPTRGLFVVGMLMMAVGFLWQMAAFAPWKRLPVKDRSTKFIRAAIVWFSASLVMMLIEPLYITLVQGSFGHGYHFGMRHAFTIGFVTMMIVAVSIKVVPNLNGVAPAGLSRLWTVFVLLNVSLVWRVVGETAGDFDPALLSGLHWSGVMAGVAALLWAAHLLRIMLAPRVEKAETVADITPQTRVASVVDTWPRTLPVFVANGFNTLTNPVARRTIARAVTLDQVCRMHDKDVNGFVTELRVAAGLEDPAPEPEPANTGGTLDPDASVAETAREHPPTVAVFTRLGMDACCGGAESIRNAAEHGGHKLADVMAQLHESLKEPVHD